MSLEQIGPVTITTRVPQFSWSGEPTSHGARPFTIAGMVEWPKAQQLLELVGNHGRQQTVVGLTGVLEYVALGATVLRPNAGWCLLQSFAIGPGTYTYNHIGKVPFTLSGVYLGDGTSLQLVVARSARTKTTNLGIDGHEVVVDPLWDETLAGGTFQLDPGGTRFGREYDPTFPHSTPTLVATGRYATIYAASAGTMPSVVVPVVEWPSDRTPRWVTDRGSDVRAYDRREAREVYGPSHPFVSTTDILVTNGLLRYWVSGRLGTPFLNVSAFRSGAWREVGVVQVAPTGTTDVLVGARLVHLTPERSTVVLALRNAGDVAVTLTRCARKLDIAHGTLRPPAVALLRTVRWSGAPPYADMQLVSLAAAKFGNGLRVAASGLARFIWPPDQSKTDFTIAGWWVPDAASTSQADSGLLSLADATGAEIASLKWNATTKAMTWLQAAVSVTSGALTFGAGVPVHFSMRLSSVTGRVLSVKVDGGAITHTTHASTATGTSDATYTYLIIGVAGTVTGLGFGTQAFGTSAFGGSVSSAGGTIPGGPVDNLMIFADALTDAEALALAAATTATGGLPSNEGRLVWYAPLDTLPVVLGAPVTTGRTYEATVEGGATRAPDANGLTKGIAALSSTVAKTTGLAVTKAGGQMEVCAFLAVVATGDDLADHHAQFGAESEQLLLLRGT